MLLVGGFLVEMIKALFLFALFSTFLLSKEIIEMNFTRDKNSTIRVKKIDFIFNDSNKKALDHSKIPKIIDKKISTTSCQNSPAKKVQNVEQNSTKLTKNLLKNQAKTEQNIKIPFVSRCKLKLDSKIKRDNNSTKKLSKDSNSTNRVEAKRVPKRDIKQKASKAKEKPAQTKKREKKDSKYKKREPKKQKNGKKKVTKKRIHKKRAGEKGVIVIIIDDVSSRSQLKKIKSLPFKVTPSIFPPSNISNSTPKLTRGLGGHFMVHLPLQSSSKQMNRFRKTLMTYHSKRKIAKRIKEIRRLFPRAVFINNHTGSTFTANYKASKRLYKELIKRGFIFVDSKTSGHSKIRRISRELGEVYIGRDIFLDNTQNVPAILRQLKKAVKIAKRRGFAVVIGHPHPSTISALRRAKHLLKGLRCLYIDEFYKWRFR